MAKLLSDLAPDVLVQCPKASDILVAGMLSDAARMFLQQTKILRSTLAAIPVVAGQAEYTLANPADHQIEDIRAATINGVPMIPSSEEELDLQWSELRAGVTYATYHANYYEGTTDIDWRAQTAAKPNVFYQPNPNAIRLVGIPEAALSPGLSITVAIFPTDPASVDDWIFNRWRDAILLKALELITSVPGKPWSAPVAARQYKAEYELMATEAQAAGNRGNRRTDRPLRTKSYAR